MNRRLLAIASLALVVVFLVRWWIPSDRNIRSIPALPDTQFDYTLTDFQSEFYNSQGQLEWVIQAPKLTHDSNTRVVLIEKPNIRIEPDGNELLAVADEGMMIRDEDEIVLIGNVIVRQFLTQGERVIRTERLHHDRRRRTIEAQMDVEVNEPGASIRAGRLRVDLNTETLEFYDEVQGEIFMDHRTAGRSASDR